MTLSIQEEEEEIQHQQPPLTSNANKTQFRANVINEIITAETEYVKHLRDVIEVRIDGQISLDVKTDFRFYLRFCYFKQYSLEISLMHILITSCYMHILLKYFFSFWFCCCFFVCLFFKYILHFTKWSFVSLGKIIYVYSVCQFKSVLLLLN